MRPIDILRDEKGRMVAVPYILTWSRLIWAVGFYVSISRNLPVTAGVCLVAAGLSDFLDGWTARRLAPGGTAYGAVLDPIMDKIFVLLALVGMLQAEIITWPQLGFLLVRDIVTVVPVVLCYPLIRRRMLIKSRLLGKAVTNIQFATILAALVLSIVAPDRLWLIDWLARLALIVSILSLIDYVAVYFRAGKKRATTPVDLLTEDPKKESDQVAR